MKKIYFFIAGLSVLLLWSCSTNKNTFFNRNFHVINTKYNVMYNGNLAFEKGVKSLRDNYEDNFYKQLPVEAFDYDPLTSFDVIEGESTKDFERSEEKAVKAIQKHSMLINGKERNRYIDEAYLLLGKSRYYSQRFVPALEAFNYAILHYPTASLYNETRIWQAKTLIRLENSKQAVENLIYLLRDPMITKKDKEEAHTALAMAYIQTDTIPKAIQQLKATNSSRINKEQVARNLFILGQIYHKNNEKDSSNWAFNNLIKYRRFPYKYRIHAKIEKIKNNAELGQEANSLKELSKLAKDSDNKPYLDVVYYQMGMLELQRDSVDVAIENFRKSIASNQKDNFQKELSFQAVADNYFNKANYLKAGVYYDSVLAIAKNRPTKRILNMKRRRNSLNGIIKHEKAIKITDSVITIADMNPKEQRVYFEKYVEDLKREDEAKKIAAENLLRKLKKETSGKWYFYSEKSKTYGKQMFKENWGERPLEDNWRLSEKNDTGFSENKEESIVTVNPRYDVNMYLSQIPEKEVVKMLRNRRNESYLKAGLIYKEQFGDRDKAEKYLEKVITLNPSKTILLSAKYHLYKLYSLNNELEKANVLKNEFINEYPDSKYAKIIENPEVAKDLVDRSIPEKEYENYYLNYLDGNYIKVIENINKILPRYEGHPLVPKYEMLKAYALARQNGKEDFEKALEEIIKNYPDTKEAKKAYEILETLKN